MTDETRPDQEALARRMLRRLIVNTVDPALPGVEVKQQVLALLDGPVALLPAPHPQRTPTSVAPCSPPPPAPHPQGGTESATAYWRGLAKAHMDKSDDLADQVESLTADLEAARGLIGRVKSFRDEVATEADTAEERAVLESLDALLAAAPAPTEAGDQ